MTSPGLKSARWIAWIATTGRRTSSTPPTTLSISPFGVMFVVFLWSMLWGLTGAFIGVPIKVGRDTVGVLTVDRDVTDQAANFETDVRFLSMVANLIGQTTRLHRSVAAERAANAGPPASAPAAASAARSPRSRRS